MHWICVLIIFIINSLYAKEAVKDAGKSDTEHVYLKTPKISRQDIVGTNVGVRPFRTTGVRIEAEQMKDKLIIHNYGYGGSGLTLAFGGAKEVLDILDSKQTPSKVIAVLGGGVVGLATTYDLLKNGYEVHLYADQWTPNLTSNVAAGIWTPLKHPEDMSEEKKQLHQRMLDTAKQRLLKSCTKTPEFAGVRMIYSYRINTNDPQDNSNNKHREYDVVIHFDNGISKDGKKYHVLGFDGKIFMEDLFSKVKSNGAVLEHKHFTNLNDILSLQEPIIVNCLSLSSRELFSDQDFIPIKGHLIHFKPQEGMDFIVSQEVPYDSTAFVFIYPWSDRIIVGGDYEIGEENPQVNPESINKIFQNAENCLSGTL